MNIHSDTHTRSDTYTNLETNIKIYLHTLQRGRLSNGARTLLLGRLSDVVNKSSLQEFAIQGNWVGRGAGEVISCRGREIRRRGRQQ